MVLSIRHSRRSVDRAGHAEVRHRHRPPARTEGAPVAVTWTSAPVATAVAVEASRTSTDSVVPAVAPLPPPASTVANQVAPVAGAAVPLGRLSAACRPPAAASVPLVPAPGTTSGQAVGVLAAVDGAAVGMDSLAVLNDVMEGFTEVQANMQDCIAEMMKCTAQGLGVDLAAGRYASLQDKLAEMRECTLAMLKGMQQATDATDDVVDMATDEEVEVQLDWKNLFCGQYKPPADVYGAALVLPLCLEARGSLFTRCLAFGPCFCAFAVGVSLQLVLAVFLFNIIVDEREETCNAGRTSMVLRVTCLLVLAIKVLGSEISQAATMLRWCNTFSWTENAKCKSKVLRFRQDAMGCEPQTGISRCYYCYALLVIFLKVVVALLVLCWSAGYVAYSSQNEALILNAVATVFILEVDDMVFVLFLPSGYKRIVEEFPPLLPAECPAENLHRPWISLLLGTPATLAFTAGLVGALYIGWCGAESWRGLAFLVGGPSVAALFVGAPSVAHAADYVARRFKARCLSASRTLSGTNAPVAAK